MRRFTFEVLIAGLAFATGALLVGHQQAGRHAREFELQRAAWEAEKADLEAQVEAARVRNARLAAEASQPDAVPLPASSAGLSPQELLKKLAALKPAPGPGHGHALRQALGLLEQLRQAGPAALPALREFLASGQDVPYEATGGRGRRDLGSLAEALAPPSLRLGLFDVLRQIGGANAEAILAEALARAGRGLEVAYLARLLEEMAPGNYKDAALARARSLLASGTASEREFLFDMLRRFSDTAYVGTAQTQVVQSDGKVDRGALRYLQQTLGEQSVALAAQLYQDSRLAEPGSKEPLARLALTYVGVNDQAAGLFHTAVFDQTLTPDQKRNLIEDLNQDGLSNTRSPTPEELQIITKRYELTQAYLQQDYVLNDKLLNAAFREADKDLRNMLQRAAAAAPVR
ncbi:MAG TPA: hypothetical protein P5205_15220 [Candidatus Paceibacterota bacterium]|nr:hypothetical protein [Verrucomicrobiota bacterium]HSA11714.1 hypothetical protein [Candidatus Paceibacterota bacterium]